MNQDGLTPFERQEYLTRIQHLKSQNVITQNGLLGLVGYTDTGEIVIAPNSYSRGYQDSFLPPTQRPHLVTSILGLFGKLSNQAWVFIPSYNKGLRYGETQQQGLKFVVLAEGERRLFYEVQSQKTELKDAQNKIKELEERISKMSREK